MNVDEWKAEQELRLLELAVEAAPAVERKPVEPVVLMERSYGGLTVELRYRAGQVGILAQVGDQGAPMYVEVSPENARDAFEHPACYLAGLHHEL